MSFYDKRAPFILGGIAAFLFLVIFLFPSSCNDDAAEKRKEDQEYSEKMAEMIVTVKPRPGVECYILRGSTTISPRSMSCVTVK